MVYGEHPNLKRVEGKLVRFCETCKRAMRVVNRCEKCKPVEPCYFCHLVKNHIERTPTKNSEKKSPKKKT